jgi:hypothetical protein
LFSAASISTGSQKLLALQQNSLTMRSRIISKLMVRLLLANYTLR